LGQGVPFTHAGSDLLRSKSLDRNSFNSGDWFNQLDFTYQANNFGVGLPVASGNEGDWPVMRPLLADPALVPGASDIEMSTALYQELLRIRYSSPLFRLHTATEVQSRLAFYNGWIRCQADRYDPVRPGGPRPGPRP
jgi:pullulanase/glycogen debranching enzyme